MSNNPDGQTQYVKTDGGYVGYQVFGGGNLDLLFVTNWSNNLDVMWQEPSLARYLDRLASFARVICFDQRGSGISDPVPDAAIPTLDGWMDDVRAVLDAVDAKHPAILADTEGGPMALLFAATFPERVASLVLVNSFARWRRAEDYPIGIPPDAYSNLIALYEATYGQNADMLQLTAPSVQDDPRFRSWFLTYQRLSMAPGQSTNLYRWVTNLDVRDVLSAVKSPTLVVHRSGNLHYRVAFGRYLGEHIPNATYVELEGSDSYPFHAGDFSDLLDVVEEFLTGERHHAITDRMLATVLFTDIVGSTQKAAEIGDEHWSDLLEVHDRLAAEHVDRFQGDMIKHTGDGVVATFDGPARAVTCGLRMTEAVETLGLEIRVGLHTGEVEKRESDLLGLAVHIAARVMARAPDGGVAVSRTVKDLVAGSGFSFHPMGVQELKGVPGEWSIYQVDSAR
jgi:class 3 adenylate cyclase